jgi:hypothetical protein
VKYLRYSHSFEETEKNHLGDRKSKKGNGAAGAILGSVTSLPPVLLYSSNTMSPMRVIL